MKIFALLSLLSVSAQANNTVCTGQVKTPRSGSSPIELKVEWGKMAAEPATVVITVDGLRGAESTIFKTTGGNTRCGMWRQTRGMVVLAGGLYSYYLDFNTYWTSRCGVDSNDALLSDTMAGGPNQRVKLECRESPSE